jgi:hypothetical protein
LHNGSGCAEAVRATATATTVKDTVHDGTVNISGPFSIGVKDGNVVQNLRIDGPTIGVDAPTYAHVVHGNVFTDVDTCIRAELDNNTDDIHDNFCVTNSIGIEAVGSTSGNGPKVDHNFVRNYGSGGAFRAVNTSHLQITDNICADAGASGDPMVVTTTNKIISGNLCDVDDVLCRFPIPWYSRDGAERPAMRGKTS